MKHRGRHTRRRLWLVTLIGVVGIGFLIDGVDHVVGLGQDAAWRHDARRATGTVVHHTDTDPYRVFGDVPSMAAVVQFEDLGVTYQALMDDSVGQAGSTVDLLYLPGDQRQNEGDEFPTISAHPYENLAPTIRTGVGFMAIGLACLGLGFWLLRRPAKPGRIVGVPTTPAAN